MMLLKVVVHGAAYLLKPLRGRRQGQSSKASADAADMTVGR